MDGNDILKAVTVRTTTKDNLQGTGVLYKDSTGKRVYIFTAKHCIYGSGFDNNAKPKHIRIDKIKGGGSGEKYQLKKADLIIADEASDIAVMVINGADFPGFESIPLIHLARPDLDRSAVLYKGYPSLTGGDKMKSGGGTLHTADVDLSVFQVEPDSAFLKFYKKSNVVNLSKGFSGSGIFTYAGGKLFVQGIISSFNKAIGFDCVSLESFVSTNLPELQIKEILAERYFPDEILEAKLDQTLEQLKPRYQELNFTLPVEDYFAQLEATAGYRLSVMGEINPGLNALQRLDNRRSSGRTTFMDLYSAGTFIKRDGTTVTFRAAYQGILELVPSVRQHFNFLENDLGNPELWQSATESVINFYNTLLEFSEATRAQINADSKSSAADQRTIKDIRQFNNVNQNVLNTMRDLAFYLREQRFASKKYMLVKGEAGNGKSQLMGYIAKRRQTAKAPSVLILGQSLTQEKAIWTQIKELYSNEPLSDEAFLQALDLKGKYAGRPVIVFIDAINEGKGIGLWNRGFSSFFSAVQSFENIKVVLSYRNSYERALFRNVNYDRTAVIEHEGFSGMEKEAVAFFFAEERLPVPVLPYYSKQFANPLFLKLFTALYADRKGDIELHTWEGTMAVYSHYFRFINEQMGHAQGYDADKLDLVDIAISKFVKRQLKKRLVYLKYHTAFKIIQKAVFFLNGGKDFFEQLISRGLFYENRYLTGSGPEETGVDFSYQKLGEYIKVRHLVNSLDPFVLDAPPKTDGPLFFLTEGYPANGEYQGFTEAITVLLPFFLKREIFEIWPGLLDRPDVMTAFMSALGDRASATVTAQTKVYLKQILKGRDVQGGRFWEQVLNISFQPANALNTAFIHDFLMEMTMPERDANWGVFISNNYYGLHGRGAVSMIIEWALDYQENQISDDASLAAIGKSLFWFFSSNNRELRDHAGKAAVFLFTGHITVLIKVMKDFEDVNDSYIAQRIYAVAFGVAARNHDPAELEALVTYTYRQVFGQSSVVADILLRDYARLIIEYGIHSGVTVENPDKIRPPYQSAGFANIIMPENDEVDNYPAVMGYTADSKYEGIHSVLHSMITEYGRPGNMYGDFGRYTFGYAVRHWQSHKDRLLSNLAVKIIVEELGYSKELSELDSNTGYTGRGPSKIERIGKKYQWIAFHRILALLSDHDEFYESTGMRAKKIRFSGPWEPNVRDFDPTTDLQWKKQKPVNNWWLDDSHKIIPDEMTEWVKSTEDLPDPLHFIELKDEQGDTWLVLESHHNWRETDRELWYQIRSYLIPAKEEKAALKWLAGQKLMGRWMPESQTRTELFLREYFWSPAWKDFTTPEYGGKIWQGLRGERGERKIADIAVTAVQYLWEKGTEQSSQDTTSLLLPNEILFNILGLRHGHKDGHFVNALDHIIAFDPSGEYDTPSRLIVRKKELLEALAKKELSIFWTGLGEKLNTGRYDGRQAEAFRRLEISDKVHFDGTELRYMRQTHHTGDS